MPELLNTSQRSSLTITLRMFEEYLRQADAWLQDDGDVGILYRRSLRLSPERRAAARQRIASALAQIVELSQEFSLEQLDESVELRIAGEMSVTWANLCDICSEKLRRYGAVDPRLGAILDQRIDTLIHLALSLISVLKDTPAE